MISRLSEPTRPRAREGGFSLLETMMVVTILGLGAAMAAPNFLLTTARAQLKQAAKELNSNLSTARMLAMNQNRSVTVAMTTVTCPPASANCGRIQATFTYPGGGTAMESQTLPGQITQVGGTPQIQFSSLGLRVGGGAANQAITLGNSKGVTFEVQVTPGGRVRWCASSPCT